MQTPMQRSRPTVLYAAAWIAAGALVVSLALLLRGDGDRAAGLPAVEQPDLRTAARVSRCTLATGPASTRLNPPADGPASARPPRPAVYDRPLRTTDLIAALRRGTVVIQYRPGLPEEALEDLRSVQAGLPRATLLAPNATGMSYAVAVAAHRRLLGCPRYDQVTRDAVRLFRGRYVGTRPGG